MAEKLRMETKCYDANEFGYLYGLNQKIPDEEFDKVKSYMRDFRRKDFVDGIVKVTGRPEGYRCLEKDVAKVEEILGIEHPCQRQEKIEKAFEDPIAKANLKDKAYELLNTLFKRQAHIRNRTCQGLQFTQPRYMTLKTASKTEQKMVKANCLSTLPMECGISLTTAEKTVPLHSIMLNQKTAEQSAIG